MVSLFSHSTISAIACRPTLAALPEELIVKILEWCDFKGVLACQWVRSVQLHVDSANDDTPTTSLPFLAVIRRRAALSEMLSRVRRAYGINLRSPNTECAMAHRAI